MRSLENIAELAYGQPLSSLPVSAGHGATVLRFLKLALYLRCQGFVLVSHPLSWEISPWRHWQEMMQRSILPFLALSSVLLALLWTYSIFSGGSHLSSQERSNLVSVLGPIRPSEGRLYGFSYTPYTASASPQKLTKELAELHSSVVRKYRNSHSPQLLGELAIFRLYAGRAGDAAKLLDEAVVREPLNPVLLNDLAATYLTHSRSAEKPFDLVRALSSAEASIQIERSREALFNRALILELLQLRPAAKSAWEEYLEPGQEPGWSVEARKHLAFLNNPDEGELWTKARPQLEAAALSGNQRAVRRIVHRFPQPAQAYVEDSLLSNWADAVLRNNMARASGTLKIAKNVASELVQSTNNHLTQEMVSALEEATFEPLSSGRLAILAQGHLAYKNGLDAYLQHDSEKAQAAFRKAYSDLSFGRSSVAAAQAELYLRISGLNVESPSMLLDSLSDLQNRIDVQKYPSLAGKLYWIRGIVHFRNSEPVASLQDFLVALSLFERMNAWEDVGAVNGLIAENLHYLGDSEGAWRHLYRSLTAAKKTMHPWRSFSIFDEAADAALKEGEILVALHFRDEVVRMATRTGEPVGLSHALLRRAETYLQLGRMKEVKADLESAKLAAQEVREAGLRNSLQSGIILAEGEAAASSRPRFALSRLDRALEFYLANGGHFELPRIYLARYKAYLKLGDTQQATESLKADIGEYERRREGISDSDLRMAYFDQARKLFDLIITLEVDSGNEEAALQYAERGRAFELRRSKRVNTRGEGLPKPLELAALIKRLPRDLAVVEYALLEDRWIAWVIASDGVKMVSGNLNANEVRDLVLAVRRNIDASVSPDSLDRILIEAHAALVRPVLSKLVQNKRLVIIADKYLHLLPFACLRNGETGRYLVQDYVVTFAPSATMLVEGAEGLGDTRDLSWKKARIFAIGDPAFDRSLFSHLPKLDQARAEAAEIAALSPGATVLLASDATEERFLREAGEHEVVHVASHSIANQEFPLQSMIVLAPSGDLDSGILTAKEIYQASFNKTRLVVLASCSTGAGSIGGSEGILNLARPFLANGVPTVLTSLWQLDDRISRKIFVKFHRLVRDGDAVPEALRKVQVELIEQPSGRSREPATWGGLQAYSVGVHF